MRDTSAPLPIIPTLSAHWFQYLDEPLTGRTLDGENAHMGFVTVADVAYEGLVEAARTANLAILRDLCRLAINATPAKPAPGREQEAGAHGSHGSRTLPEKRILTAHEIPCRVR